MNPKSKDGKNELAFSSTVDKITIKCGPIKWKPSQWQRRWLIDWFRLRLSNIPTWWDSCLLCRRHRVSPWHLQMQGYWLAGSDYAKIWKFNTVCEFDVTQKCRRTTWLPWAPSVNITKQPEFYKGNRVRHLVTPTQSWRNLIRQRYWTFWSQKSLFY